jgi:hypothetical protein
MAGFEVTFYGRIWVTPEESRIFPLSMSCAMVPRVIFIELGVGSTSYIAVCQGDTGIKVANNINCPTGLFSPYDSF